MTRINLQVIRAWAGPGHFAHFGPFFILKFLTITYYFQIIKNIIFSIMQNI